MAEAVDRVQAALDGDLDAAGWQALAEQLRRDPAARARWWAAAGERAALAQALGEDRGLRRHARPLLLLRRLAVAAGLLLAVGTAAWLARPSPPAPIVVAGDRIEPAAGTRLSAVDDALTRRWRLESGRIAAQVARAADGRGFAVETPFMLVEVTGTRFELDATAERTRVQVSEGAVLARAGGSEVVVPAGAWAERGPAGWTLASGLAAQSVLWDGGAAITGQAPLRRGMRTLLHGARACAGTPGEETPNLRTIAIDLPEALEWRGDDGAVLELRYHLGAAADPKHPPRASLQGWGRGPARSLQADLAADRPGQFRLRLAVSGMESRGGSEPARIRSLIITARPEAGLVLLDARILRP